MTWFSSTTDQLFVLGVAVALIAALVLYAWWIVGSVRSSLNAHRPARRLRPRDVARWPKEIQEAVSSLADETDRARLAVGLVWSPRDRRRRTRWLPPLWAAGTAGATLAALSQLVPDSPFWFFLILVGALVLVSGLIVHVGALWVLIAVDRWRDQHSALTGAAGAVSRLCRASGLPATGSRYDRRLARRDAGTQVHAALSRAGIPTGELDELRHLVDDDDAWTRLRSTSLRQVARAYDGDFVTTTPTAQQGSRDWWERSTPRVTLVLTFTAAALTVAARLLDLRPGR